MSRKVWLGCAIACGVVALGLAVALTILVLAPKDALAPEPLLPIPPDRPLLTEQEKEWAQEDGVAGFWFDGMYYVVDGLDPVYWR